MLKNKDIIFIGAGPSSIFGVLTLIKNKFSGNILIIDKGKSLKNRQPDEILNGMAGAGCFSDSKLTSSLYVGGDIDLSQEELNIYNDQILETLNSFNFGPSLKWDNSEDFDTHATNLTFDKHLTCHIGTDWGRSIYWEIEKYLESLPNIELRFETEVSKIELLRGGVYKVFLNSKDNMDFYITNKLIIAVGQKSTLPSQIIKDFKLTTIPRALQLGIRVEDEINEQYKNIIKANYDFKFVKNYKFKNNVNIRVRTFCCNSGNAHTCAEKTSEGFICFNGHAYKTPDPNNNSVNYGIICEVEGLKDFASKESQIELMKKVNNKEGWFNDNLDEYENPSPKRYLLDGFDHLKGYYPDEVLEALTDFTYELNKLVDLSKAKYLYPEIKLSGNIPELTENFETRIPGLFMIGDCSKTRGIMKAAITGIIAGNYIGGKNVIKD